MPNIPKDEQSLKMVLNKQSGFSSTGEVASGLYDVFHDWAYPQEKEARQMEEQLLMDKIEPSARMKGLKDAGINPNTAAAGVVGSQSQVPASSESVNPIGDVAGAVGGVAGAAGSLAGSFGSIAKGIYDLGVTEPTIAKLTNEASFAFEQAGLTGAQKTLAIASAQYADENALRDIQIKRINVRSLSQNYKNLKAVHEQILADIDLKIEQARLNGSQADYYDQLKLKTQEETRWIKEDNDFWDLNGFNRNASGPDAIIAQMIANSQDPDMFIDAWSRYSHDYRQGSAMAEAESSWHSRPSTAVEAAAQLGTTVGTKLRSLVENGIRTGAELLSKVASDASANAEFEEAYKDYRHDLYDIYRQKRRLYNNYKHGGNTQYVAQLKSQMDAAKKDYDDCTRSAFSDILVSQFMPR